MNHSLGQLVLAHDAKQTTKDAILLATSPGLADIYMFIRHSRWGKIFTACIWNEPAWTRIRGFSKPHPGRDLRKPADSMRPYPHGLPHPDPCLFGFGSRTGDMGRNLNSMHACGAADLDLQFENSMPEPRHKVTNIQTASSIQLIAMLLRTPYFAQNERR
jgi:hypothetical protein